MNLEEEMLAQLGQEMANEVDREILWGMLIGIGWTRVTLSRLQDNKHAVDIGYWLAENCQGEYKRNGRDFLFDLEKDATMFILRWSS